MRLREYLSEIVEQLDRIERNQKPGRKTTKKKDAAKAKGKTRYGDNVLLTDEEYKKLQVSLGAVKTDAVIKNFDELLTMKGYKYASHYMAIVRWGVRAYDDDATRNAILNNGGKGIKENDATRLANNEEEAWRLREGAR